MAVFVILALIWAIVLVPPAWRVHAARRDAFLDSFGTGRATARPVLARSAPVQRRRRIVGGLLVAMASTLAIGLLPTFRVFLVVHLLLVDSFLAYIALLAHTANRAVRVGQANMPVAMPVTDELDVEPDRTPRWRRAAARRPELVPLALS